ncbi:MlaA family lipoprotein [Paenirhodobacter populi]|uniref:VacJ family lipoprotein n=1 Tax=Paenirhodobacter populi TaxID=2306993 RepID=A0A443JCP3_9RHOB|nr:VacJ family lipoprotein [Sinirhodobacter populi]RWR06282.1 VacJ family lipoprotein [Sinirhodobacter populi]RWR06683.1 VacJ family lipoprotein [Sinirhodobacter populi]RWR18329.1 VacJ family lipoprotein [Sinirhodobacter populi]RWR27494.1 VacJ family lipoprotein [Sinirhodobacter populi]RWR27759.1 VacJ family lipoprotein [Sinirhodobacter populi]
MLGKGLCGAVITAVALGGCGVQTPQPSGIDDPYESSNRSIHAFNKGFDEVVFKAPPGKPRSIDNRFTRSVSNVGSNLGLPGKVVNSVLQGRPEPAVKNTFRFLLNSTIGIAGIFDPAGAAFGLPAEYTDFGETLAVWGVHEGSYVELPFYGPSTTRDAIGTAVDIVMNPVGSVFRGSDAVGATTAQVAGKAADRKIYGDAVESILYDSADSYAQARLLYLQNRRYHLAGQENNDADAWDPYSDPDN